MVDELLVATEAWLPRYKKAISEAKIRLADPDARIPTREGYQGAARLKVKSIEEMSLEQEAARDNASKADKG